MYVNNSEQMISYSNIITPVTQLQPFLIINKTDNIQYDTNADNKGTFANKINKLILNDL